MASLFSPAEEARDGSVVFWDIARVLKVLEHRLMFFPLVDLVGVARYLSLPSSFCWVPTTESSGVTGGVGRPVCEGTTDALVSRSGLALVFKETDIGPEEVVRSSWDPLDFEWDPKLPL